LKRIDYLAKQIEAIPEIFPLQPNIPRVSDLLAWLSEHPQVVSPLKEKEEGALSSLQIENFIYALTKHPEQGKKDEKYQVKVDLEFSSPTPKQAREFHDALIAPNDLVDPKAEVKWSSNRGKYRTSFFLKDKTSYSTPSASQFGGK
jgi:type IV pilus assembly protein PilM